MQSLRDKAYEQIYEWIVSGKLKRGEATSELALCRMLDMSRTPIRAALQRLEYEGFLKIVPKHGIIILDSSAERVSDLLDILISYILFSIHSLSFSKEHVLIEISNKQREHLEQLLQQTPIDIDELITFEFETLLRFIALCQNDEMMEQFKKTAARLFWFQNKKRWEAPYHRETIEIFMTLLETVNDFESFRNASFRYLQTLKSTWR